MEPSGRNLRRSMVRRGSPVRVGQRASPEKKFPEIGDSCYPEPIVALVALWGDWSSAPFVLTAIGLGSVIVGVYVVANVWKEPLYDVIPAWDPEAMPADWEAGRRRYFTSTGSTVRRLGRRSDCFSQP